ncbi:MAG: DMT family transporter [Chloroflexi bacterium]|nr:MAG: DMT family transporter [Chloroflexota bacterium]MBL1192794.1 DMT family transporter [Chloroflexota bacterium]NOH10088.1 DMT family transporter [Chloroflexota bacterium]
MNDVSTRQRVVAIISLVLILLSMSFGTILMKMVLFEVKPLTLTWLSVLVGMLTMGIYTFVIRREKIPRGFGSQVWIYILIIGLFNFVISRITRPFALERLPAITTTFLSNFIGLITMGMSIFVLKESPTIFQLLGAVVAVTGLTIYFEQIPSNYELVGVLLVLVGITAVAYTNNIARKFAIVTDFMFSNNVLSTLALLFGGTITVIIGLIYDWPPDVGSLRNWGIIVYVGVVTIGIGLTGWNYFLRVLRSYEASILGATSVIWTAILALIFLGETLNTAQIAGISLLIIGLILVQVRRGKFSDFLAYFHLIPSKPPAVAADDSTQAESVK